jgi:hypothetical protein
MSSNHQVGTRRNEYEMTRINDFGKEEFFFSDIDYPEIDKKNRNSNHKSSDGALEG